MDISKFKVFGLYYDNVGLDEAVARIDQYIKERKPRMVFTTGAELIVRAQHDAELKRVYESADLLTIDSHVGYFASRLLGKRIKESVSAANLMFRLFKLRQNSGYRFYFLGAKPEVLTDAVRNLKLRYPNINVVGQHHGYFDFNNDAAVVGDIINAAPDILLVAMSSPLKERFISRNLTRMNVPVSIGVGGSIDILSGRYKFAPKWVSKIGLEWFYRLIQEPGRLWKRYLVTNTLFIGLFIKEIFRGK